MKVIFLDIDGVMNSTVFYKQRHARRKRTWKHWKFVLFKKPLLKVGLIKPTTSDNYKPPKDRYTFKYQLNRLKEETCHVKWKWLSDFCNENDVKICVSSVWKNHFRDENGRIPYWWEYALQELGFKAGTFVGITDTHRAFRGEEIKDWLDKTPNVFDYAILDDDSDMLKEQFKKFHFCDHWYGLTPNTLYRIKRQFEGISEYEHLVTLLK